MDNISELTDFAKWLDGTSSSHFVQNNLGMMRRRTPRKCRAFFRLRQTPPQAKTDMSARKDLLPMKSAKT
jgi:hypothetical protein